MQKSTKWFLGLALVAALVLSVSAVASAPPKVLQVQNQHLEALARVHDAAMTPRLHHDKEALTPDANKQAAEAYTRAGYGFSEGYADQIATNGKVTVWSNGGTYWGNITFAPANDIAHPTAMLVGAGSAMMVNNYTNGLNANPIQFVGDKCYISVMSDIYEFDCSDVNNITFLADYDISCYCSVISATGDYGIQDFRVKNGYLWVALGDFGFAAFQVGNPTWPVVFGNGVHSADNPDFAILGAQVPTAWFWPTVMDVTDDTLILVDTYGGYVYVMDITNMIDPVHTIVAYHDGAVWTNPFSDILFSGVHQFQFISGWCFVAGSDLNYDPTTGINYGVTRFDWQDESNVDTFLLNFQINSVNDGFNGRARYVNNFAILGTGSMLFTAYEDVRDPGPPFTLPDIDGDAGSKWDWSNWSTPNELLVYKMDRFFFNNEDNFETPVSYNVFYGGAHICFAPVSYNRAFIAGWNYLAAFDEFGMMVDHYVVGSDPIDWPFQSYSQYWNGISGGAQPLYKMPAGASVWNHVQASDDSFTLIWYPEGVYVHDNASGMRIGFWEMTSRIDFVRNVAITSDNHYALVACGLQGLVVLDLSNPANPVRVGNWWTNPSTPTAYKQPVTYVFINGRYAYVQTRVLVTDAVNPTANINVVRVLDISNPPLPAEVAAYPAPVTGLEWDVNHMELANAYTYQGNRYIQISNGQGRDENTVYSAAFGNSGYNAADGGSFIVANVTTPSAFTGMFNVPLLASTYAFMSAFYVPTDNSNYWAYIADGFISVVDMGDPASGLVHTLERRVYTPNFTYYSGGYVNFTINNVNHLLLNYPTSGGAWTEWPNFVDKVWRVKGANQILTSYDKINFWHYLYRSLLGISLTNLPVRVSSPTSQSNVYSSFDHWDATLPLNLWFIYPYGSSTALVWQRGYWFSQLSDDTWFDTCFYGDAGYWSNFTADYIRPAFTTSGPMNNGWWTPYCGSSTYCGPLSGPIELKVQVIDNVAVTRVTFGYYYYDGADWSWELCSPGAGSLGNATGPDANNFFTKTISPADFGWTGWVQFYATARDAAYNYTTQANTGGFWFVNAIPSIDVTVGPAGTDYDYIWSTTTVAAKVSPVQGDTHVIRVLFKVDGLSIGDGIYNPSTDVWYVNFNTTQVGDGNHVITAEATLNNSTVVVSDPVEKYVANLGPESLLLKPVAGSMVYGTTEVSAQLKDENYPVPIDHVGFYLDRPAGATSGGTLIGTATSATGGVYKISWDASTAVDGNHTIVAVFFDKRWDGTMRSRPSTWVSFSKVTPTPIIATISATPTNPTDAQTVAFSSTVSGGIAPYTYEWSSSPAGLTGSGPGAAYRFAAGAYTITLKVKDTLGTEQTATMSLTVTNSVTITSVTKMSNPFRLQINGGTFLPGCSVKIGNAVVTNIKYVNASQLIAKKCKNLCPKGQAVQIVVVNPDGTQSAPFTFTR